MIRSLTIRDFRALRGTRTHSLPEGVIAFLGANERGKTSTCLAIAWAFYGAKAMPRGIDGSDIINDHAKETSVTLVFDLNGDDYELTRSQKRSGGGDAILSRNGTQIASGRDPVTREITDLLGVDHEGFMVSTFARQNELDALAGKQGADRITTVLRLMGVEQADKAVKALRKQANEARRELDVLRAGVPDIAALTAERDKAQADAASARKALSKAIARRQRASTRVAALREQQAALGPARAAYSAWRERVSAAQAQVQAIEQRIATFTIPEVRPEPEPPKLADVPEVDEAKLDWYAEQLEGARSAYADFAAEERGAEAALASLTDTCPTCDRPFENADEIVRLRSQHERTLSDARKWKAEAQGTGERLRNEQAALSAEVKRRDNIIAENERKQREYENAVEWHKVALLGRQQAIDNLQALKDRELPEAQTYLEAIQAEAVPDPSTQATKIESDLYEAQQEHTHLIGECATLDARIKAYEGLIAGVDAKIASARGREQQASECEQRVVTLDVSAREMASMKERLIAGIIPALEERASALVSELTSGKHTELHLTSDYEIQYRAENGEWRSFASLSGSGQAAFALALRLAIADVRAGAVSFLVLDEVFAAHDEERQQLAWEAIEHLARRYAQVLVVSHTTLIKEMAPNVITV